MIVYLFIRSFFAGHREKTPFAQKSTEPRRVSRMYVHIEFTINLIQYIISYNKPINR